MFYFKILEEEERRTRRKKGEQDKKEIIRTGGMKDRWNTKRKRCRTGRRDAVTGSTLS